MAQPYFSVIVKCAEHAFKRSEVCLPPMVPAEQTLKMLEERSDLELLRQSADAEAAHIHTDPIDAAVSNLTHESGWSPNLTFIGIAQGNANSLG